jgi:hypothetical protein
VVEVIRQLNIEQARRLSKLKHDPDQSLSRVYESIRFRALQGDFEFPYVAAALSKTEINMILESLSKNGFYWAYDPSWKIIHISWKE